MRTRYGVSPWLEEAPASRRLDLPRFRGDRTAEVVIIGGGLTGCAIAHACVAAGFETLLLERDRIGHGGTGRSAGLLSPEPGPSFRDVAAAHGLRAARRVFETWRRGALDGAALIRRLNIRCDLDPRDLTVIASREEETSLRREFDARRAAGMELSWLTPRQLSAGPRLQAAGAYRIKGGFALDPYRACSGLASAAIRRGAILCERSLVRKVRFTRKYADVIAEGGTIRTSRVIVATGSASAEFKSLQRHFTRRELYLVKTAPVPAAMRKELGDRSGVLRDFRTPPQHVRWTPESRLLVAGADQDETADRKREAVLVQRTGQLMYELLTKYPAISGLQPEYGWEASYGEAADGLMYIGAHRNFPHHVFALGGRRDSLTGAFVAARIVTRAMQAAADKADDVFGWNR